MAIPGRDHLFGLKEIAYATPYKNEPGEPEILGFELIESENLKYTLKLDGAEKIRSLFMMTPYAYRTPRESRDRVLSLDKLTTEVEFEIFVYKKSE
jgi:23S rRNA (guanine745-N1)-methyltransferase